ncbi:hypothetical protein GCM10010503_52600 [Streptomyces lucensis JCM 4490]|uniref:Uncharacterized protein n=1 Tax=Streptomyces lucensis JCM 4490 TaxID=1306176 RepID=A0A918JBN3_9ACTN|nr:hypothetical protein [Streptomyces lucensis]GGW68898.1 hypothetical protein GCM10010503_52600 [Streptomyces lucensis JCM 4490]
MTTPHWIFGDQLGPHFLTPAGEEGPGHARMRRAVQGLDRLADLDEVLRQERRRANEVP